MALQSLGHQAASAHAARRSHCGQSRRQNANDDLNHRLPRFLLHSSLVFIGFTFLTAATVIAASIAAGITSGVASSA